MSQDIRDLGSLQPVVDGDGDQAGFEAGEVEIHSLDGIAPVDGDAVAGLQSLLQEPARQRIGGPVQGFIGDYLFATDDRELFGIAQGGLSQRGTQIHGMQSSPARW